LGGVLAKLNYGVPLVITIHSLEPLRPWKREQLGRGYDFSSWIERTAIEMADAIVAVSQGTKEDVLRLFNVREDHIHIIYNGIDPDEYRPIDAADQLPKYGVDPKRPYVLFVGRIARQKGIIHLVDAIGSPVSQVWKPKESAILCEYYGSRTLKLRITGLQVRALPGANQVL
jgi:glycosyltransferase involved in cell wall biosynthesis